MMAKDFWVEILCVVVAGGGTILKCPVAPMLFWVFIDIYQTFRVGKLVFTIYQCSLNRPVGLVFTESRERDQHFLYTYLDR